MDTAVLHTDGTQERSSFRSEQTEAVETNDTMLFGSMLGWRESSDSPTNSENSIDTMTEDCAADTVDDKLAVVAEEGQGAPQSAVVSPEELFVEASERKLERGRRGSDRRKTLPTKEAHISALPNPASYSRTSSMPVFYNRQKPWTLEKPGDNTSEVATPEGEGGEDSVFKVKPQGKTSKAFASKNAKLLDRRRMYAKSRSISEGNMFNSLSMKAAKLGPLSPTTTKSSPRVSSPLMSPFLGLRRMLTRESGRWSPGTQRKADAKNSAGEYSENAEYMMREA